MPRKTLHLVTDTDDDRPIFVAGTFNSWSVAKEAYRLLPSGQPNEYSVDVDLPEGTDRVEYKYTRGGWEAVELGPYGASTFNHTRFVAEDWSVPDLVVTWANKGLNYRDELLPKIEVLSEKFEIPTLIRTRRIAALLPHDYYETDKHYPVLYLQDGQNLLEEHAPYGSWGVDKRLASMAAKGQGDLIVIAIDHAADKRVSEFTPSFNTRLGKGDGRGFVDFLVKHLKPYVDQQFRTLTGPEHTGVGGSSMGGLLSIYAGILYPRVYERLMIFSPSLWVTPKIPFHLMKMSDKFRGKIYLYGGEAESKTMVSNMRRFRRELEKQTESDQVDFRVEVDEHGQHNEARWGVEFPKAVEWLFFNS
ncbi:alpha/beta hydrolase [Neolewinella antarctica]|uniref:Alpha/beta superfamily hydrolase n=1 Tax=Neolewinella antarctica TaxID=442734 RepID=A0ABX0XF20_9BACT|nr:alpha/beta hydrolase-fold protein [Neolewinella antarctica]NJC27378.1 putative alpha/beta superfamily hydrolase [Neolewinella antarctica]